MVTLSAIEARVAGVLMEKESTTPEYYPLSLNATVNACNQKSSREPVMSLSEGDVRQALYELEQLSLVRTLEDARVPKYEHRMRDGLGGAPLRRDEVAVLCLLLLRGAQTPAELRARAERLYAFEDPAAAQSALERLAGREEPLVALLPKMPGSREARWMHLLCGDVENATAMPGAVPQANAMARDVGGADRMAQLEARVDALEIRLAAIESGRAGH